jgi:hypothetical protein
MLQMGATGMDGWMDGRTDGLTVIFKYMNFSTFSNDLLANIKTPGGRNRKIIRKLYQHIR